MSLKYHINPFLTMHVLAREDPNHPPPEFERLALKSLYTYRCRHHRRRPYPTSHLAKKESDCEPTHELVKACHALGIWTDTAWCTTPGPRCHRRRENVKSRAPMDQEVWVVFDRLWRSRNWIGPIEHATNTNNNSSIPLGKRKRDCRFWEHSEIGAGGESLETNGEGKAVPMHTPCVRRKHCLCKLLRSNFGALRTVFGDDALLWVQENTLRQLRI